MADVAFTCPQCGQQYQFAPDLAGKRGRCKTCQAVFRIPESSSAASTVITRPKGSAPGAAGTSPPAPRLPRSDEGKVAFQCPDCGHGYRLDASLAGKQGRCTSCRGVFTIPAQSSPMAPSAHRGSPAPDCPARVVGPDPGPTRPQARPDATRTNPLEARPAAVHPPPTPSAAAGDSGWWELDSEESIPTTTARPVTSRPRSVSTAAAARPAPSAGDWRPVDDDDDGPVITAKPVRPKWVLYVSIAVSVLIGGVAYSISYSLVSRALRPESPPTAERPTDPPPPPASPPTVAQAEPDGKDDADAAGPDRAPPSGPQPAGAAGQHREAITALTLAYQQIADGYARIRDINSISDGNGLITRGVAELKAASRRGKGLPPLATADRRALIRETGPPLLQAIDRVLVELRRLQTSPGLRSDFDRLIAAYTRTRERIQREVDRP